MIKYYKIFYFFIFHTFFKGNISYSYIKSGEPKFSNIKELREIHGAFITNPTSIQLTSDSETKISLLSGNTVSNIIKCIYLKFISIFYFYFYFFFFK